jgi:DnaJ like chaperone protein
MRLWQEIFSAGARLFGPPALPDTDGFPGLGAKMAKADGQVRLEDIAAFKRVFQSTSEDDSGIARFFDLARQTTLGYERYARLIARKFRARPAVLEDVMDGLFHIALADGVITDEEHMFLKSVCDIFGFSEREFKRIQIAHCGRASDDPYLILGIDEDISDSDLKRAYRRMAAANHPDRLAARGLPRELTKLATQKMAMINRAYDTIRTERARYAAKNRAALPKS